MGVVYDGTGNDIITKTQDVLEKEREYAVYIVTHCNNVKFAFKTLFCGNEQYIPDGCTAEEYNNIIEGLKVTIAEHDKSKFSDEEFYPYRVKFYPTEAEKKRMEEDIEYLNKVKNDFEEAWKHHYMFNDHHTKHWLIPEHDNIPAHYTDMPYDAIIHMICDWCAMSLYFDKDMAAVIKWYKEDADKEKSEMTEKTKSTVEDLLQKIFKVELK